MIIQTITGKGSGLVPTIRVTAPVGSTVSCDGQTKVVGSEGFVDFVVSAEPVSILPDGVQGLESIEATGTQWINTGLIGNTNLGYTHIIDMIVTDRSAYWYIFGSITSSGDMSVRLTSDGRMLFTASTGSYYTPDYPIVLGGRYKVEMKYGGSNGNSLSIDGTVKVSNTVSYNSGKIIPLFACTTRSNSSIGDYGKWACGGYEALNSNNKKILHFFPCTYNSQVGMWDVVSNSFFGNQGTGSFIAGEPKEWMDYPTYTVTATLDGKTATEEVKVDEIGLFNVELDYGSNREVAI